MLWATFPGWRRWRDLWRLCLTLPSGSRNVLSPNTELLRRILVGVLELIGNFPTLLVVLFTSDVLYSVSVPSSFVLHQSSNSNTLCDKQYKLTWVTDEILSLATCSTVLLQIYIPSGESKVVDRGMMCDLQSVVDIHFPRAVHYKKVVFPFNLRIRKLSGNLAIWQLPTYFLHRTGDILLHHFLIRLCPSFFLT